MVVSLQVAAEAEAAAKVDKVVEVVTQVDINVLVGSVIVNTVGAVVMEALEVQAVMADKVDEEMDIIGTAVIIGGLSLIMQGKDLDWEVQQVLMEIVGQEELVDQEELADQVADTAVMVLQEIQAVQVQTEAVLVLDVMDIQADKQVRQDQVVDLVEVQAPNTLQVTLEVLV